MIGLLLDHFEWAIGERFRPICQSDMEVGRSRHPLLEPARTDLADRPVRPRPPRTRAGFRQSLSLTRGETFKVSR
jgi:hypothetical protein